ncbi:enoyl-CoA hydratase [Bacillus sp. AGMB 02131]|uniref:Enoyl-CoA hydratase n=2 Tax=Peribacillus faecalis TaxID=2772559 RepID=A0A927HAW4_9BACI|nr:enoyl-CoA hydratase [Peribacillus faecalis]MBD3107962.1 enoyl-CoA hydratase [Peribacillus faecalis]
MGELVKYEIENRVATVTIDNPPMNVLSSQVTQELDGIFTELASNPAVGAVVLTGNGSRAFMAGADIKEFPQKMNATKAEKLERNASVHEVLNKIADLPKPTIASLNGLALGGGCELSLTCDIRIAEEHVKIGLPEIKLGLFPGGGGTQRLPRIVGPSKAKELMFVGDPITAQQALELGLVNQVVPSGEGLAAAQALAGKIAQYSADALSFIKQAVNKGAEKDLETGLALERELFADVFETDNVKEGVRAFLEKRSPVFNQ